MLPAGDLEVAEAEFQQVIDSYGRTEQADMARLYLARIALSRGQTDEARAALVELARKHDDDVIGRLANLDLINLRIASGQGAEVAADLRKHVARLVDTPVRGRGVMTILENKAERAKLYVEVAEDLRRMPAAPFEDSEALVVKFMSYLRYKLSK